MFGNPAGRYEETVCIFGPSMQTWVVIPGSKLRTCSHERFLHPGAMWHFSHLRFLGEDVDIRVHHITPRTGSVPEHGREPARYLVTAEEARYDQSIVMHNVEQSDATRDPRV